MQTHYDYSILGAGLSGLTVALRMSRDPFFASKRIAIIDQDLNKGNDRTWCFWETEADMYETIISHKWSQVLVKGKGVDQTITITPYSYKKIESSDLYTFTKKELSQYSNISFIQGSVKDCLLYTSPSPRDKRQSRMPSSA